MKLSRIVTTLMFVGIVGLTLPAPEVYADPVSVGQQIYFQTAYGNENRTVGGNGGEGGAFGVYDYNSNNFLFNTFCVETNEYIYLGSPYHVGSITGVAVANGSDVSKGYQALPVGGDPLDTRTAYLFSNFAHGTLGGYNGDATSANALQRVIWYIEQEYANAIPLNNPPNNPPQADLDKYLGPTSDPTGSKAQAFFSLAASNANGTLYDVQVLNVVDGNDQSMLVLVPEPGILILLGLAMSAIGIAVPFVRKI